MDRSGARRPSDDPVDLDAAEQFIDQFYAARPGARPADARRRCTRVRRAIAETGTYRHTAAELTFGARVAWRNSARCIGRLYWNSLHVRDRRAVTDPRAIVGECARHLRGALHDGRIRSTITVFAPDGPGRPAARIRNDQLIRYAAYRKPFGQVLGDPPQAALTELAVELGWRPPSRRGRFDVLPLVIETGDDARHVFPLPADAVVEVPLSHPDFAWFAELGLRWHAVPAISNMHLEIGGLTYPAAPFNGWYMSSEIGARNLADPGRYDLVPTIAERMGLDRSSDRTLWRDRAVVELTLAVQYSFDRAGIRVSDHHTESSRFLIHLAREEAAGRSCPTDWTWIVPPLSGAQTPVFHRYYDDPQPDLRPAFVGRDPDPMTAAADATDGGSLSRCPVAPSAASRAVEHPRQRPAM